MQQNLLKQKHNIKKMTKTELVKSFSDNHNEVITFIHSLTDGQFLFSKIGKWSAGQQLRHVYLTLTPFTKVLPSKEYILEKFGKLNRPIWNYETVLEKYLTTNLKAPEQFLPEKIEAKEKTKIINDLQNSLIVISQLLDQYSENELDTLMLPHPLLGNLTIREMFYLMSYHPTHHLKQTKLNLEYYTE